MTPNFGDLTAAVAVADTGSFTAAARRLGMSASALGKLVARLEKDLGSSLFQRSTRSLSVTTEGERFVARCRRILEEYSLARTEIARTMAQPRGRLRVSMPHVSMLTPALLTEFARHHPQIELDLHYSDRLVDVIADGFDAVIRTGAAGDSRLLDRPLASFRHCVIASPAYIRTRGRPEVPNDLKNHTLLFYRFPTTGMVERWPLEKSGSIPLGSPSVTANSLVALIDMCTRGLGIACIPEFAISDALVDGRILAVLDDHLPSFTSFRIQWPKGRPTPPKVRLLVDFIVASVGEAAPRQTCANQVPRRPSHSTRSGTAGLAPGSSDINR